MSKVKNIWFDLGFTLVKLNREELMCSFLSKRGYEIQMGVLEKTYHLADKKYMRNRSEYLSAENGFSYERYFTDFAKLLKDEIENFTLDDNEFMNIFTEEEYKDKACWHCFDFTHDVLSKLSGEGYTLGLISNWDNTARTVIKINNLEKYFDYIVISEEIGVEKPDRRIFEHALSVSGQKVGNCLYVGDNYYDDVVGSRKVGMKSLLINRFGNFGIEEIDHPFIFGIYELPDILKSETEYLIYG